MIDIAANVDWRCRIGLVMMAISLGPTLNGCAKRKSAGADTTVGKNSLPQKVYASHDAVKKAKAILSSATYLDNLVAGERAPAREHIWAYNVLLRSADPRSEFMKLFDSGNHYVRCYALIGLKMTDDENYRKASQIFSDDKAKKRYAFGCEGLEITNLEFINLLDTGRIKRKYFEIENFDPYLEDQDRFVKDAGRFMMDTGFGL